MSTATTMTLPQPPAQPPAQPPRTVCNACQHNDMLQRNGRDRGHYECQYDTCSRYRES